MRWFGLVAMLLISAASAWGETLSSSQRETLRASGKVSEALLAVMDTEGRTRVLISYHEPTAASADARHGVAHRAAMASRADAILATLSRDQFVMRRRFVSLPAIAGEIDLRGLQRLVRDPNVHWVEPSLGGGGALAESSPLTHTDTVRASGLTGQGVRIAVLDSGVDADHQDLAGTVVEERCWCSGAGGCCPGGGEIESGPGSAADDHGHGTHVTGIIASNGSIAAPGAAPDVDIVAIKVLDSNNSFCCDEDVLDALDWINIQSTAQNPYVDVVNLSLATGFVYGRPCNGVPGEIPSPPWTAAVSNLTDKGILVVAAAGNQASSLGSPAPACVQESFSVAASYDADVGSFFWQWGPTQFEMCVDNTTGPDVWACGTNAYDTPNDKTDLVAPGSELTSSWPGDLINTLSGTSQAAPQVAGCAALILEAHAGDPTRTLPDLEADLRNSPTPIVSTGAAFGSSFPRLDCATAVPEPRAALQSLALLLGLAAVARRAAPSRHAGRCASSSANTLFSG